MAARVSRVEAATHGGARGFRYDSLTQKHSSAQTAALEDSFELIDTAKGKDEKDKEFSCAKCCGGTPRCLYNYTLGSCFTCCQTPKTNQKRPSPTTDEMSRVKALLNFHFKNPFEKWRFPDKRRFPWKLVLQVASIILVTWQLVMFANSKFALTNFLQVNKRTFTQLFILNPADPSFSNPVPSPIRVIYTNDELFEQLNYTASQYFNLKKVAVGPYGYQWPGGEGKNISNEPHLHLIIRKHTHGDIDPTTKTYYVSPEIDTDYITILNTSDPINDAVDWSKIEDELTGWMITQKRVLGIHLDFTVSSIYIPNQVVKCFQFNISFQIENDLENGNMPVDMSVDTKMSPCDNNNTTSVVDIDSGVLSDTRSTVVDGLVIVVSILSIVLCGRSLIHSLYLTKVVRRFFLEHHQKKLRAKHYAPLFNFWFVGIIVSNGMVLVGSVMKLVIAYTNPESIALVDTTSVILGLAAFGQWCGIFRFLSYFDKYNILLITLRLALPSVMRFAVCAGVLYISFLLLGWLVLGPYNPKFRDPSTTSECLFSLLNGDDMFATYQEMSDVSTGVWIFSKVYLYTFISLFIYVVLSVFISLISDTYEKLHDHWRRRVRGLLRDFATDQLERGRLRSDSHHSNHSLVEEDAEDYDFLRGIAGSPEPPSPAGSEQGLDDKDLDD